MLRHEEVEHPQPQQQQPSESLMRNDQHDAKIKEAITHYTTILAELEKSAQATRKVVDETHIGIRKITSRIHGAEEASCQVDNLHTFLAISDSLCLQVVPSAEVSTKTNKIKLTDFVVGEQTRLDHETTMGLYQAEKRLWAEMERLDQKRHHLSAMRRVTLEPCGKTEMKVESRDWESGLLNIESTLRKSFIDDPSVKVGIIQPSACMNPLYELEGKIGISEPCRKVMDAWHLVGMKSEASVFWEQRYQGTDKQDNNRLENACLPVNFMFDLKKTNAGEMLMPQQLMSPFLVLLNSVAAGCCVPTEECKKPNQDGCASSIDWRKERATKIPTIAKIDNKPDGGVNLRQGYEMFGMRQIYKCAMMTERVAILIHDNLEGNTLRKGLALPFILATGKTRSLYLTILDEQGNARIHVVNYPEAGKRAK